MNKETRRELRRLEARAERWKIQREKLERKLKRIKEKEKENQTMILDVHESEALDSRVDFYDQHRIPHRTWPRIQLDSKPFPIQLLTERNRDLMFQLSHYLSPREYQSLSLTSKYFQQLLHQTDILYHFLDFVLVYLYSCGMKSDSVELVSLTTKRNDYPNIDLLLFAIDAISVKFHPTGNVISQQLNSRITTSEVNEFQNKRILFFHPKTGEFGEVTGEVFYSDIDYTSLRIRKSQLFEEKYGFHCNRNLMSGFDVQSLYLLPVENIFTDLSDKYPVDIYLVNHSDLSKYYQRLTSGLNKIRLIYYENPEDHIDIYYDWFEVRRLMRSHYPSWVHL